jgi:hypothetical protein
MCIWFRLENFIEIINTQVDGFRPRKQLQLVRMMQKRSLYPLWKSRSNIPTLNMSIINRLQFRSEWIFRTSLTKYIYFSLSLFLNQLLKKRLHWTFVYSMLSMSHVISYQIILLVVIVLHFTNFIYPILLFLMN